MSDIEDYESYSGSEYSDNDSDSDSDNDSDNDSDSAVTESSDEFIDHNKGDANYGDIVDGRYFLIHKLGYGTYSTIWLSYLMETDKFFAIKIFHTDSASYGEAISEGKKIAMLQRIKFKMTKLYEILQYIPLNSESNTKSVCFVFDILTTNVKKLAHTKELINEPIATHIVKEVAKSLQVLHNNKYIYSDLRSENIMIKTNDDRMDVFKQKFLEINWTQQYKDLSKELEESGKYNKSNKKQKKKFSLLRRVESQQKLQNICNDLYEQVEDIPRNHMIDTNTDVYMIDFATIHEDNGKNNGDIQSRNYMAPEIIIEHPYTYKVDVWSLGCVFYEMLSDTYLFNPHKYKHFDIDNNHLFWIIELLGRFPNYMTKTVKAKKYFDKKGRYKENISEKDWCIEKMLEADEIQLTDKGINLFKHMVKIDPKERYSYIDIINACDDILNLI